MTNIHCAPRRTIRVFGSGNAGRTHRSERMVIFAFRIRVRHLRWLRLYREPDVWSDPAKRDAMLRARMAYHDAKAQWGHAARYGRSTQRRK